eukprot:g32272.t1
MFSRQGFSVKDSSIWPNEWIIYAHVSLSLLHVLEGLKGNRKAYRKVYLGERCYFFQLLSRRLQKKTQKCKPKRLEAVEGSHECKLRLPVLVIVLFSGKYSRGNLLSLQTSQ